MKRGLFLLILILAYGCGMDNSNQSKIDRKAEEKAVLKVIQDYHDGAEKGSFYAIEETLANDVVFYGTDSAETIMSRTDFKNKIEEQWKNYSVDYAAIQDVDIVMDDNATVASVIYGMPIVIKMNGLTYHAFTRNAKTLKKEGNRWRIHSGIVGLASKGPDFAEFVSRLSGTADTIKVDTVEKAE